MDSGPAAPALRERRDSWIVQATAAMCRDDRFIAAGLWGSLGRGDDDDWSDVDLVVVIRDGDVRPESGELKVEESVFGSIGVVVDLPQNGIAGGAFISATYVDYQLPLHVDWYLCPASAGGLAADVLELFGHLPVSRADVAFADLLRTRRSSEARVAAPAQAVLSMIPIAVKYLVRGSPRTADVLALAGVDPTLASDRAGAFAALDAVLANLEHEAGTRTAQAFRALLDLGRDQ